MNKLAYIEREFQIWMDAKYPDREDRQSEFRMTPVRELMLSAYTAAKLFNEE